MHDRGDKSLVSPVVALGDADARAVVAVGLVDGFIAAFHGDPVVNHWTGFEVGDLRCHVGILISPTWWPIHSSILKAEKPGEFSARRPSAGLDPLPGQRATVAFLRLRVRAYCADAGRTVPPASTLSLAGTTAGFCLPATWPFGAAAVLSAVGL